MRNMRRRARSIRRLLGSTAVGTLLAGSTMYANFQADNYFGMDKADWTVTRASSGYAVDLAGNLVSFGSNVLRRTDRGVLVEQSATNTLTRSQEFDNANWTKSNGTVTANSVNAPDGTLTADTFTEDTANGPHGVNQNASLQTNANLVFSVYLKPLNRTWMRLVVSADGGVNYISGWFNLSGAGSTGSTNIGGTGTTPALQIEALAGGWYRCIMIGKPNTTNTSTVSCVVRWTTGDNVQTYAGTASNICGYMWGAQAEQGSFATSYIATTTGSVTRAADAITITGATFTKWYVSGPGTLFLRFVCPRANSVANQFAVVMGDGTINNRAVMFLNTSNQLGYRVTAASVAHLAAGTNTKTLGNDVKAVVSWQANLQVGADDGNNAVTGTGATNPTMDRLQLGQDDGGGAGRLNGYIEYIEYSPAPIDAATAKVITAP